MVEPTGVSKTRVEAAGGKKAIVSAPSENTSTFVTSLNDTYYDPRVEHRIVSNAS